MLLVFLLNLSILTLADDTNISPLIVTTNEKRRGIEYIEYNLDTKVNVQGTHLAIRLYLNASSLATVPMGITLHDTQSNTYSTVSYIDKQVDTVYLESNKHKVPKKMYWNKAGFIEVEYLFNGIIYIPYQLMNFESGQIPTDIKKIQVNFDTVVLGFDELIVDIMDMYLFEIYDVTFDSSNLTEVNKNMIVDFNQVKLSELSTHTMSEIDKNVYLKLSKGNQDNMFILNEKLKKVESNPRWIGDVRVIEDFDLNQDIVKYNRDLAIKEYYKTYAKMGQNSEFSFIEEEGYLFGSKFNYRLNSQAEDYDSTRNVYASIHFNLAGQTQNWNGAKGLTIWVKNPQNYPVSFAIEVFQYNTDTYKLEQYNLNNASYSYKTIYAYNTVTNEEFSYQTQTYMRIPGKFEGWLRIPFSQYEAPQWTLSSTYGNQGILNIEKYPIKKLSLSRLFSVNQSTTLIVDNIGVYYNDFTVGNLFDESKLSIRQCLSEDYKWE